MQLGRRLSPCSRYFCLLASRLFFMQKSLQYYFFGYRCKKLFIFLLWIPSDIPVDKWAQGLFMIAVVCKDARIILLRLPTSHLG
jgi:hypothetical protein